MEHRNKRVRSHSSSTQLDKWLGKQQILLRQEVEEQLSEEMENLINSWSIDCIEKSKLDKTSNGYVIKPWDFSYSRCHWHCNEDHRLGTAGLVNGECEHCLDCKHWPLTKEVVRNIYSYSHNYSPAIDDPDRPGNKAERSYWEGRYFKEIEEDGMRSEAVTVPQDSTDVAPSPTLPAMNEPVIAIICHKATQYNSESHSTCFHQGDIIGFTFEYSSGATQNWSHVNSIGDSQEKEYRFDLLDNEHILKIYFGFDSFEQYADRRGATFELSSGRFVTFHNGYSNAIDGCMRIDTDLSPIMRLRTELDTDKHTIMQGKEGEAIHALTPRVPECTNETGRTKPWLFVIGPTVITCPLATLLPRSSFVDYVKWKDNDKSEKSLASIAGQVLKESWVKKGKDGANESQRKIDQLIATTEQSLERKRESMLQEIYSSKEALNVIQLRKQLEKAEKLLNDKAEETADIFNAYGNQVQRQFDLNRHAYVKQALQSRQEQIDLQDVQLNFLTCGSDCIDIKTKICIEPTCSKLFLPCTVPLNKRCGYAEDGTICSGALSSCGCCTTRCPKCLTPICDSHFAQHKRACMLKKKSGGRNRYANIRFFTHSK